MTRPSSLRRDRSPRTILTALAVAIALVVVLPASAIAVAHAVAPPPANPTSASQIQNIDQVKTAIKAYYGDTVTSTMDPINGTVALHTFSPTGAYAKEMARLEDGAMKYLDHAAKKGGPKPKPQPKPKPKGGPNSNAGTPAILLDVDDTTLNTYNYEIYSNFVYNPAQNAVFVNGALFPAVPGMPALVTHAVSKGYQVFYLTGRPEAQRPGTTTNLTNAGYPTPAANHLYLKDQVNQPWLSSCSPTCTTIQYKSLTRQHIESLGFDIVANFGDQYSDLTGGFADKTFKVPNPMYYLP
jgi:hypothetical protein